jgi:outer membrane biosynthesis protein TonB
MGSLLEVGTGEHKVAAPRPEGPSGLRAQWAGERPAPSQRSYAALTPPSSPPARQSPQTAARWQPRIQRMSSERWRMASSLLLSLLIHGTLLSLTFDGKGLGLPGLRFPWQERRIEVPELRVVLVPAPIAPADPAVKSVAGPAQQASIEPPIAGGRAAIPHASPAPPPGGAARAIVPATKPKAEVKPERNAMARAAPAKAPTRAGKPAHAAPAKIPKPAAIDVAPSGRRKLVVPPALTGPDVIAVAPSVSSPETVMPHRDAGDLAPERIGQGVRERAAALAKQADRLEATRVEAAKLEAARQEEAARVEAKRLEAERQETSRLAAAQLEAGRQETARQEAARVEAARLEAERQEAARLAAAQLEAQRQQAARQEEAARIAAAQLEAERLLATRQEAARVEAAQAAQLEAERQEAARQEVAARIEAARRAAAQPESERLLAARQEAARVEAARTAQPEAPRQEPAPQEKARAEAARPEAERHEPAPQAAAPAAPQEVARGEAEKEEGARREARRRAIGRQLDEEAAQREATPNAARQLPLSLSTARRARLWGRGDPNVELVQYAEGWARKIQFNTPVATVREVAKQPHSHPMVTVAIRSDGSVESVTFVVSSGVAQVDDAIRRIVQSHEHYQAFPPALAREYDVIEIRRTWHFHDAVQLY